MFLAVLMEQFGKVVEFDAIPMAFLMRSLGNTGDFGMFADPPFFAAG